MTLEFEVLLKYLQVKSIVTVVHEIKAWFFVKNVHTFWCTKNRFFRCGACTRDINHCPLQFSLLQSVITKDFVGSDNAMSESLNHLTYLHLKLLYSHWQAFFWRMLSWVAFPSAHTNSLILKIVRKWRSTGEYEIHSTIIWVTLLWFPALLEFM